MAAAENRFETFFRRALLAQRMIPLERFRTAAPDWLIARLPAPAAMRHLADWDPSDTDVQRNTIDRWLERREGDAGRGGAALPRGAPARGDLDHLGGAEQPLRGTSRALGAAPRRADRGAFRQG